MVNEFRTLLANVPYRTATPQDHIAKGFAGLVLPQGLRNFRSLLFPENSSRYEVLFSTTNLVNVVNSTMYRSEIVRYDRRITYTTESNGTYFTATRIGIPAVSNSYFPLFTYGDYAPLDNQYVEIIKIAQIDDTAAVRVYSGVTGKVFIPSLTLNFSIDKMSQDIPLRDIGITLKIAGTDETFVESANKTWEVTIEAPRSFDALLVLQNLKNNPQIVAKMLNLPPAFDTSQYEIEWRNNQNDVYKLAAILICYVARVKRTIT